ncbi:unnamed protein product [Sphagnum troendelagicum]
MTEVKMSSLLTFCFSTSPNTIGLLWQSCLTHDLLLEPVQLESLRSDVIQWLCVQGQTYSQACHQLLWNVLNHVNILVKDEKAAATGKSLSITALQIMEIALTSISMSDGLESYKTCKILNHQICVAGRIRCSFSHHLNLHNLQGSSLMISFINIKLTPYRYPGTAVVEWATGSSSMYNLLQELGSLNNVYCLEYAKHILQLLHSSFPTYFMDELSGSKSDNSAKCQVQAVNLHIEHWRLKKERQAAILARFSAKNNPILGQHNDQPNDDEHKSDDTGSLCFAPYDEGKQQEEQVRWSDSIIWSPAPQQDFSGFVNMHDPADSSEMLGSVYHLMREGVQHTAIFAIQAISSSSTVGLEVHVLNHTTIPGELDTIYPRGETRDSTAVGYTRHTTLAEFNIITPGEDCALPVELAGQLGKHQPHYIAAADKEHSSSSHKGRQKAFQGKHNDPREQ